MNSAHVETDTAPAPIVHGLPEALFRLGTIQTHGSGVRGSMPVGDWLAERSGRLNAGSLGVLIDDVLGYAILRSRPADHWSVSTEITLDMMTRLRGSTTRLHAEADALHVGARGGFSTGIVRDEADRLVAHCTQRARFIPGRDSTLRIVPDEGATTQHAEGIEGLLGRATSPSESVPEVAVDVTSVLQNPRGNLHGGIALCASDLAASLALGETNGPELVTSSVHIVYTRPVPADATIRFRPEIVYRGRSLAAVDVIGDIDGKACTTARITAEQAD